ncbi:MAG: ABC transporter transmembrane domain-containing protein, partial [Veillonella sp.]|uniref:ABC transporter transmembrane domain-containing protein n=1 Tax=Veillonella sp. TaxID=1926307 RepID=UPI0029141046
ILDFFIPNQARSTLNIISIGLIAVYLFRVLFEYSRSYLLIILGQRMSMAIMLQYFKHVLTLPMNFFATRKSGEIISRFLDASKIIDALASATLSIFLDIGMVLLVGVTLAIQNSTLFLITLCSLPFYVVAIFAFVKSYEKSNREEMAAGAAVNSSIIESLKGIETIKAYSGEEKVYNRIDHEFVKLMKKSFRTVTLDNIQQGIKHLIQLISSALILWLGSYFVMDNRISLGQLITYNALLVFLTDPLQNIINLQVKMQTAQVANNRLNEVYMVQNEFTKKKLSHKITNGDIEIKNVNYSYQYNHPILKDINWKITPGTKMTVVGMSGSGKSTLMKLLVNYFNPTSGQILINGLNILDIDKTTVRSFINYIPQNPYVFSGTIK